MAPALAHARPQLKLARWEQVLPAFQIGPRPCAELGAWRLPERELKLLAREPARWQRLRSWPPVPLEHPQRGDAFLGEGLEPPALSIPKHHLDQPDRNLLPLGQRRRSRAVLPREV